MCDLILDHVEHLVMGEDEIAYKANELVTLRRIWEGLDFLARSVTSVETEARGRFDSSGFTLAYGNTTELRGLPISLLASFFDWYSVSATKYVRLVAYLAWRTAAAERLRDEYVKRVLGDVFSWRNKSGAHVILVEPRSDDSVADRAMSVLSPLGFDGGYLETQPLMLSLGTHDGSIANRRISWSLTRVHTSLAERYQVPAG